MKIPINFKPMKATKLDNLSILEPRYPLLATPKWDGIRTFTFEPVIHELFGPSCEAMSLTLTKIPNQHIQEVLRGYDIHGLDGELITYTDGKMDDYNTVQSKVMGRFGEPDFKFHVFDLVEPGPYWERMRRLKDEMHFPPLCRLVKCLPRLIKNEEQLVAYEEKCLLDGFEGVMLRGVDSPYKFGRSTLREGYLLKMKRFLDAEATVIGFEELMRNENEAELNATGNMERSSHKANLVPGNTLGALVCVGHNGIKFNIGTGFDASTRDQIWQNQQDYKLKLVKYKYQPHGVKTAPRCPVFLGFRSTIDVS